jgi:D-apionolactonase
VDLSAGPATLLPDDPREVVDIMSVPLCYYGSPDPLPVRRLLRAGLLTAVYEAGDLRYVKIGGVEVCRRWYAAVCDSNWGTVPGVISDEVIEESEAGFRVTYTSTHRQGEIHFVWRAEIVVVLSETAHSYGVMPTVSIRFRFNGEALATFLRNRIGFSILHPTTSKSSINVALRHSSSEYSDSQFPLEISPTNPFQSFIEMKYADGHQFLWWFFEGDHFETEDQRNWIDASFKTFCTPLSKPFPVEVFAGDKVEQEVLLLAMCPSHAGAVKEVRVASDEIKTGDCVGVLPNIGLGLRDRLMGDLPVALMQPLHISCELDLTGTDWVEKLRRVVAEAGQFGSSLELAIMVSDDAMAQAAALVPELAAVTVKIVRVLIVHQRTWATTPEIVGPIVEALSHAGHHPLILGGTIANFTELNRNRPPLDWIEGVAYSVQPQEHAFDNASLVECCAIIADTVRTARSFSGDKPVSVGPITLSKRVNPYATGPWEQPPPDPRQRTLFAAVWTLGALKYLAESGVASATFYETTGPRGVMDGDRVFPLYHVLTDANDWAGATVQKCESSDPLRFEALVLKQHNRIRILLANMTAEAQTVTLDQLPEEVTVRSLDETTFVFACTDPVAFRYTIGDALRTQNSRLTLSLKPYAYVRIDG